MLKIEIEIEQEADGRWIAEVPELPRADDMSAEIDSGSSPGGRQEPARAQELIASICRQWPRGANAA